MQRIWISCLVLATGVTVGAVAQPQTTRLEKAIFVDKCKGALAGQMIGVTFGAPTEFQAVGSPIIGALPKWEPANVKDALNQDDCYVEMTFLKALEDSGLELSPEQAGKAFAESKYPLWHANLYGRDNVRRGIMPPLSGRPENNRHADDIDFQIESDLFGIICPGLPHESNRLCDVFGHIMNYGDGVYGGMFMAGMYSAAYFEDGVRAVVEAGLKCIPAESLYAQCIRSVIEWHDAYPRDWMDAWRRVENKWQDDVDCMPNASFNIDAKLNGAYVVIGLLYGEGDMAKTLEIATRCGQDSDCNPSSAAGVLGCIKGFDEIGAEWTSGLAAIEDQKFSFTEYSPKTLLAACQRVAEQVIQRVGGAVEAEAYVIPVQEPCPAPLEQWENQIAILSTPILPGEIKRWSPDWRVAACGLYLEPGYRPSEFGRDNVLVLHPVSQTEPAALEASLLVPADCKTLVINVASHPEGDYVLKVYINGQSVKEERIATKGTWKSVEIDVAAHAGKTINVRIENWANNWFYEAAYFAPIEFR